MRHIVVAFAALFLSLFGALHALDAAPALPLVTPSHSAASAPAAIVVKVPVNKAARAKFPKDPPRLVDAVAFINLLVNAAIKPEQDETHYGQDLWVEYPSDGKGDCEDYAITKFGLLERMGWNVVARAKLIQVGLNIPGVSDHDGHELLALRLPSGAVAYLDMNFPQLMTRRELERAGYRFYDWRA